MGAVELMTPKMLEQMRESCQLAAACLVKAGEMVGPGVTTDQINTFVHDFLTDQGAYPSPLNYGASRGRPGFPKSVCTSVNEVVCHGIPDGRPLADGDIVNIDVTGYYPAENGFHGDTSATFYVGEPSEDAKRVTETARRCLELGIAEVKHGARLGDIGAAIQEHALSRDCEVVRDYVGHGVGRKFHMPPQVPHYGKRGSGKRIKAGMVFTIEPMINLGHFETELMDDEWTVLTADRSLSAQFEHTIVVTREGCEVLTTRQGVLRNSEDVSWAEDVPLSAPAAAQISR